MAEAVVVAGAQQRQREPEVAFQRRELFDERALSPHFGEVAPAVDAPEPGDLRAEALGIGVTPLRLDGVLLLMVPKDQRQRRRQLGQEAVRPPLRDPTRIAPHDDDPAAVVGLGRGIDVLGAADRQGATVRLRAYEKIVVSEGRSRCILGAPSRAIPWPWLPVGAQEPECM
jgi:hypothetical protein